MTGTSPFYWLLVGTLAVWRVTHLLNAEDGPGRMLVRLRSLLGNSAIGEVFDCFYCLSIWIAGPLAFVLGPSWKDRLLLWLALSGGAILLERITAVPPETFDAGSGQGINERVPLPTSENVDVLGPSSGH